MKSGSSEALAGLVLIIALILIGLLRLVGVIP
jgi:hypothetical protein